MDLLDPHPYLVHPYLVHPHTGEPLQAVGYRRDGTPIWPILGAGPEEDPDDDESEDDEEESDEDESDDDEDESEDDDEKKTVEYWKRRSRQNEREARKAKREADRLKKGAGKPAGDGKGAKGDDEKVDPDKLREEIRSELDRDRARERVADKIEAKATKFADPEDVVAILLRTHDIEDFLDDDNKVDVAEIADALKELGEKKPHLLAQGGKRFEGSGDGGARPKKPERPKNIGEALQRHFEAKKKA